MKTGVALWSALAFGCLMSSLWKQHQSPESKPPFWGLGIPCKTFVCIGQAAYVCLLSMLRALWLWEKGPSVFCYFCNSLKPLKRGFWASSFWLQYSSWLFFSVILQCSLCPCLPLSFGLFAALQSPRVGFTLTWMEWSFRRLAGIQ